MIHKAFAVLESISATDAATIDSISEGTGIPRSTVHRILQALQAEGVVRRHAKQGYALTPKLLSLGLRGIAERSVLDAAIPVMRELNEQTKETISLNVLNGYERVCIYRIEGTQPITRSVRIGANAPLFVGSAGKVIAAGLTPRERERILARYMDQGIFKQEELPNLLRAVEEARELGYAISIGERVKGSASLAVPLKDVMGNVMASLSVATLESRLTPENKNMYLESLLHGAQQIQQQCIY